MSFCIAMTLTPGDIWGLMSDLLQASPCLQRNLIFNNS